MQIINYDISHNVLNIPNNNTNKSPKNINNNEFIPKHKNIFNKLLKNSSLFPNKIIITYNNISLTYSEFISNIFNFNRYLKIVNLNSKEIIGVYLDDPLEMVTSIWGVVSSGSAYLPLSTEYPDSRIKYMVENSNIKYIITSKKLSEKLNTFIKNDIKIILTESYKNTLSFPHNSSDVITYNHINNIESHDLCYIIYTSGSTGKPKGVMIDHSNIFNQMQWLEEIQNINFDTVLLQKTPISFDAAQWEILSLACGSHLVLTDSYSYMDPTKIISYINKYKINTLQCVPTLLQGLIDTKDLNTCMTLKYLFIGGEALNKNLVIKAADEIKNCVFINLYGPTECTINSSAFIIDLNEISHYDNVISIGKPITNMSYYILNECLELTPNGEIGELYIAGMCVGKGYLNNLSTTNERFIPNPYAKFSVDKVLYKTGDLVKISANGNYIYYGRSDNQVKLRGYRIELDEIKSVIETHQWIKHAAVIVKKDPIHNCENLIAFIELNSNEAVLMDQGKFSQHHISKENKHQVLMQLAENGLQKQNYLEFKKTYHLDHKDPNQSMTDFVFARKSYRYYEGKAINKNIIIDLINSCQKQAETFSSTLEKLTFDTLSEILRYFGKFQSSERLLPKYSYASPGALYATQMYLECNNLNFISNGFYYFHPVEHMLYNISNIIFTENKCLKIHFIGKKSAIESVYKLNIKEVLEFETGHILGVFDKVLSKFGLQIENDIYNINVLNILNLNEDYVYLGSYQITPNKNLNKFQDIEFYLQCNNNSINDLEKGLYVIKQKKPEKCSSEYILEKEVIAINQVVYQRSHFGISLVNKKPSWHQYIDLGRCLQHLQMNELNIGLMSSGYSSKTGHSLPSAIKINKILNLNENSASYFCLGGSINNTQIFDKGMKEDSVHMQGPSEIILEDLRNKLPIFMQPNKIITLEKIPLTANGKIDIENLKSIKVDFKSTSIIKPRNTIEKIIYQIWQEELNIEEFSVNDNFFSLGGNSIIIIKIINKLKNKFKIESPIQILFEYRTIEKLAEFIKNKNNISFDRVINLNEKNFNSSIFCWPGLGGFCLNLKNLSTQIKSESVFYGIQSYGINENEEPFKSIQEMALEDIKLIKKITPSGPYKLWGYSFGAQIAYETCYLLEQLGNQVSEVVFIAPGMPNINNSIVDDCKTANEASFLNKKFVAILFSVFMRSIDYQLLNDCIHQCHNEDSFINYILSKNIGFDYQFTKRIVDLVKITYNFIFTNNLKNKIINAPIKIFITKGDAISNFERDLLHIKDNITIKRLPIDHYSILQEKNFNFST